MHLEDVVAGHLAALEKGKRGERYILGGENLTVEALISLIADLAGVPAPGMILPPGLVRFLSRALGATQSFLHLPVGVSELRLAGYYFYYETKKAQRELGLGQPKPARQALADALDWFAGAGAVKLNSKEQSGGSDGRTNL